MTFILNENQSCATWPTTCNANKGLKCSPVMESVRVLHGNSDTIEDRLCVKELQCNIMLKLQSNGEDLTDYRYVVYS